MKKLIIPAALIAVLFTSCRKCDGIERTYQCAIDTYETEAIAYHTHAVVPFTGTQAQVQQFELSHSVGTPGIGNWQECHCR